MSELSALYNAMANEGDDSEIEVTHLCRNKIIFLLTLDVWNSEKYLITLPHPGPVDLYPFINLGSIIFGGLELLPDDYLDKRWSWLQSEENLRVMKITDDGDILCGDMMICFVVYSGQETIEAQKDHPLLFTHQRPE